MKPFLALAGAMLALAIAAPAAASIVEYQYSGSVAAVFGPAPDGVVVGDLAQVRVRFDPSTLVDVTAEALSAYGAVFTELKAASLRMPGSELEASVGPNHFTLGDQFDLFPDPFAAAGGTPYVLFENGNFFGVQYLGVNPFFSAFATAGANLAETFDFVGGNFSAGGPSYAGFFDYADATSRAVPEPASWTLMIAGFGLAGTALRRRRIAAPILLAAMAAITTSPSSAAPLPAVSIAYGDLKLSSPTDAAVMLQRIRHAAASACQQGRFMVGSDIATIERFETCRREATSRAVTVLNAPLVTAAFNGHPSARFERAALTPPSR